MIIVRLLVNALAVAAAAYILPGVVVEGFWAAVITAVVIGFVNAILRPIIVVLTLPINFLTFGLFTFVINAVLIMLASSFVPGFSVENFWWALLFSLVLGFINGFLGVLKK
ncbi:MAG: phage holin family protein [bacterium]|nr:phage holin family protein [bacterium]